MSAVNTEASDAQANGDLSAGALVAQPTPNAATDKANQILVADATARRWHRHGATVASIVVISFLLYILWTLVCAVEHELGSIGPPAVAIISVLVIAVSVLAIALLRSTFAPVPDTTDGPLMTPTLEGIKELKEIAKMCFEAMKTKGG